MKIKLVLILISIQLLFANDIKLDSNKSLIIYFDTPNLYLLENNLTLNYQAKKYISKKNKIKYKESITYISKSQEKHIFKVKHYNNVKFIEEKHPLISLIKRKDREVFLNTLKKDGIKYPLKLKYVFEIYQKLNVENSRYRVLFDKRKIVEPFFNIKFQYPFLVNLLYAISSALIGLLIIFIFFRKRIRS